MLTGMGELRVLKIYRQDDRRNLLHVGHRDGSCGYACASA